MDSSRHNSGFTLIEIAIVLVIVGLIAGTLLPLLGGQVNNQYRRTTITSLANVQQALIGFAISNGRLPCPDRDGDGQEDRTGANSCFTANFTNDRLPSATLGVSATDPWGQTFRYRVSSNFADSIATDAACPPSATNPNISFGLCSNGDINISNGDGGFVANLIPAIVFSLGENFGITNGLSTEELENRNNDVNFVSRSFRNVQTTAGGFDDLVTWVPTTTLTIQMANAGRLP